MADASANDAPYRLIDDVRFGDVVVVYSFSHRYGCTIGDETQIGPFVEIQRGASIGPRCKIQSHSFILDGVTIEDEVIVGHGVCSSTTSSRCDHGCGPRKALGPGTPGHACPPRRLTLIRRGNLGGVTIGEGAPWSAQALWFGEMSAGERRVAGVPARLLRP